MKKVLIGNASGFWGDRPGALATLASQAPDLDFITLDYLAEVSMSIMANQQKKNPDLGYAPDFLDELEGLSESNVKIITNAGGLNPKGLAKKVAKICKGKKIAIVSGDDVLHLMEKKLINANAYLGAWPIVEALKKGADIVITGRVADPSLTVAAAAFYYGWGIEEYDKLAGATVAGHLIECGTQSTGGISTNWLDVPDVENIGFPYVEVDEDGSFVITKPKNTGGFVNIEIVKEQLLYEIGDPDNYLSPDVTVSFLSLKLEQTGENRVKITGAKGKEPPSKLKVSAGYEDGFMASGTLTVFGEDAEKKARRMGEIVFKRLPDFREKNIEVMGNNLRLSFKDNDYENVKRFTKEIFSLVTCGAQGTTGYQEGRPKVKKVLAFWPTLIDREKVTPRVEIL